MKNNHAGKNAETNPINDDNITGRDQSQRRHGRGQSRRLW